MTIRFGLQPRNQTRLSASLASVSISIAPTWSTVGSPGSGDAPEWAKSDLAQNFKTVMLKRKEESKPAIRPGADWPIEFASQEEVSRYETLSGEFVQRILGLDWAWISDESSLWDFHAEQTNELLYAKIREVYGVDVSDIESARLWAIFERIEQTRISEQDQSS